MIRKANHFAESRNLLSDGSTRLAAKITSPLP